MGLFTRSKGDSMSRKKRDTVTSEQAEQQPPDGFESDTDEEREGDQDPAPERDPVLEPQRDGELDGEFKERQVAFAREQLTAAEQRTAAQYVRREEESDAEYQSRIDAIIAGGENQPYPVDNLYQLPEVPTVADQRAYLVHYQLASEEEAAALGPDAIAQAIALHAADLRARHEQAAMRGNEGIEALPVNPTLEQLRRYATLHGLVPAHQVEGLDLAALSLLVRNAPSTLAAQPPQPTPTIDLSQAAGELSEQPYGGDVPQHYVVLEPKALYLDGSAVTFSAAQIVHDRSHDIAGLKRLGVKLLECAPPGTIQ